MIEHKRRSYQATNHYTTAIGSVGHLRQGNDLTIAASSYMTLEAIRAADALREEGIGVDVLDVHTLNPFDETPIVESVRRTAHKAMLRTTGMASRSAPWSESRGMWWPVFLRTKSTA